MNKVRHSITRAKNGSYPHPHEAHDPPEQWVSTLFVQFRLSQVGNSLTGDPCPAKYQAILEELIRSHGGDLVALADDAALAVFSGLGNASTHTKGCVAAAKAIMVEMARANKERLAQDLSPLRVAIGLDAGLLRTASCRRHPRLDPGLEQFLRRARSLSDLNYQTPFPAIFASRAVVDSLDFAGADSIQNLGNVFVEDQSSPMVVYAIMGAT